MNLLLSEIQIHLSAIFYLTILYEDKEGRGGLYCPYSIEWLHILGRERPAKVGFWDNYRLLNTASNKPLQHQLSSHEWCYPLSKDVHTSF